ncbi:amidase [Altererythrobacter soli]|uniref:Amidase n=2 Tax=Croceibacterium soli TaxID=1739690 RepID=A0A6I4USY8_9SPHN|nr:amidase [Croceibacterium soli]
MSSSCASVSDTLAFIVDVDVGEGELRVAVKDCLDIAGFRTSCGSQAFANAPPARENSAVVQALLDHGCRIVGKANMHELAYGVTGVNAWTGTPLNVNFPERIPGGSSSGPAVAVAAGLVDFSIGTDTGGSIRVPAACCGVFGLKPTFGAVPRIGAQPRESSLDCIGPLARDMSGISEAMRMISPGFEGGPFSGRPKLGRVLVSADRRVDEAVDAALGRAAVDVQPVELASFDEAFMAGLTIMGAEMAPLFGHLCGTGLLGADIDGRLSAASAITREQVAEAEAVRRRFAAEVDEAIKHFDALVTPVLPGIPPLLADAGDAQAALQLTKFVRPFNLSGHPALSIPAPTADGLPAAVQLVGGKHLDAKLCAIGEIVAEALHE